MKLLNYTPPEDRWIPETYGQNFSFTFPEQDPLWRRAAIRFGLAIVSLSARLVVDTFDINPIDHLRWFLEGIGERIFNFGHCGSWDEVRLILNSDIPWEYVEPALKRKLLTRFPDYFIPKLL